jgi:hypothetical protein
MPLLPLLPLLPSPTRLADARSVRNAERATTVGLQYRYE